MKRRVVAVTLSLIMTMATVSEAGAAVFTSPDGDDNVIVQQSEEVNDTEQQETEVTEDIFTSGEEQTAPQDQTEDVFSATADGTETPASAQITSATSEAVTADASGALVVNAEDWIREGNEFKLQKHQKTAPAANEQQAGNADSENKADVSEEGTENAASANTEITDADVILDTANASDTDVAEDTTSASDADVVTDTANAADTANTADTTLPDTDASGKDDFYTVMDGIIKINTVYKGESHTGYYLFDENGFLVTGQAEVQLKDDGTVVLADEAAETSADLMYFTETDDAVIYSGCEGETVTPYTSTVGQQVRNEWKWTGTAFQYYDKDGKLKTVEQLEKEAKAADTYTGYFKIDDEYYCLDKDGKPRTGDITLTVNGESNLYYFEEDSIIPGRMFHEGWRRADDEKGERWLYYQMGSNPANVGKYYKRGVIATRLGTDTPTYLLDGNGYVLKSKLKKASNGAYYGSDSNGIIYKNAMVKFGNYRYYFGSSGKRATWKKRWAKVGTHYYYFGSVAGRVVEKHGWNAITNTKGKFIGWFYFDANGNHYTDKWTSNGYYFMPSGKLASGFVEINGKGYLFEVSSAAEHKGKVYKNTMVRYKKKWYIASSTGSLYKNGWKKFNKKYYYLKDYVVQTNLFAARNGVNGYIDSNGVFRTGWVVISNAANTVKYINPDGTGFVTNTSKWIDGMLYYFDKNGNRITDLTSRYTGPYTVQVDRTNGVMTIFADSARTIPVKTIRVSVGLPGTPTPTGRFTLSRSSRWQPLMGPSWGQYGTHVDGAGQGGIFVHSVACGQANSFNLPAGEYNKLGYPASHGCIRVCVGDAKWVYYNCNGSVIYIFDGAYKADDALKGPLGKKPLTPLRGAGNYDPTDPAV